MDKIIILALLVASCGPIKRHSRLVEKYPYVHTQDTIIIRDAIRTIIPKDRIDTVVHYDLLRDTIYIDKERVKVRIHTIHDSVYVDAECKEVVVEKVVERKVPIRYYKEVNDHTWLKYIIVFLIVLFTLYSIFRKR